MKTISEYLIDRIATLEECRKNAHLSTVPRYNWAIDELEELQKEIASDRVDVGQMAFHRYLKSTKETV